MRKVFVVAFVVFAFTNCARTTSTDAADKQAILSLEREITNAFLSGKCEVLEQNLANEYSGIGSNGSVQNKSQMIDSCKSFAAYPEMIRPQPKITSDADIRIYQNVAVATGKQTSEQEFSRFSDYETKRPPTKLVHETRFTKVWIKSNQRWQLVAWQSTELSPPDHQ